MYGIGERHKHEFLDSAPLVIKAAAARRTRRIRLTRTYRAEHRASSAAVS
jgi:hypothetical protein